MLDTVVLTCIILFTIGFATGSIYLLNTVHIELCGGPSDGYQCVKLPSREIIEVRNHNKTIVHRYKRTHKYTKDKRIKYEYQGSDKLNDDCLACI